MSSATASALARAIRAERVRRDMTQAVLADRMQWSRATVGAIENLERQVYAHELVELCDVLGVTLDQLLAHAPAEDRRKLGL